MRISTLQREYREWRAKQPFPSGWHLPFCKLAEEFGELAAELYNDAQGNGRFSRERECDAFADVLVSLVALADQRGVSLDAVVSGVWKEIKERDYSKSANGRAM